ncbi:MAG TPA: hypothetical protein VE177_06950, partial [Candidatus Binatus sp.]|nr:hypothetical protein [Candidatus Binatus sp.]
YNGNSLSLSAALATLEELGAAGGEPLRRLNELTSRLAGDLQDLISTSGQAGLVQVVGSMLQVYFTNRSEITTYRQSLECDMEKFSRFRELMLTRGVYFHPDGSERLMLSTAHTREDVELILEAARTSLAELDMPN